MRNVSDTNKFYILFGEYIRERYGGRCFYGKAQNLAIGLKAAYDERLKKHGGCDILLMPTTTMLPTKLPTPSEDLADMPEGRYMGGSTWKLDGDKQLFMGLSYCSSTDVEDAIDLAWCALQNTAPFNLTGHPAISIPSPRVSSPDKLPIGVQLVGRPWEDGLLLNVAYAAERDDFPY